LLAGNGQFGRMPFGELHAINSVPMPSSHRRTSAAERVAFLEDDRFGFPTDLTVPSGQPLMIITGHREIRREVMSLAPATPTCSDAFDNPLPSDKDIAETAVRFNKTSEQ